MADTLNMFANRSGITSAWSATRPTGSSAPNELYKLLPQSAWPYALDAHREEVAMTLAVRALALQLGRKLAFALGAVQDAIVGSLRPSQKRHGIADDPRHERAREIERCSPRVLAVVADERLLQASAAAANPPPHISFVNLPPIRGLSWSRALARVTTAQPRCASGQTH